MEKIKLSPFLNLEGIGAASGIIFHNKNLYIISDNSGFLFEYALESNQLSKHVLIPCATVNIEKKNKPDFEAITLKGTELHIFGSASTTKRNKKIIFNLDNSISTEIDYTPIYAELKNIFSISDEDLNIEGALYIENSLLLFQRGNSINSTNGIFNIRQSIKERNFDVSFHPITLPQIQHIETTFTDAIEIDEKIYFLATAEDTLSTYHDGDILGTILGIMNSRTFEIEKHILLSSNHKLEGITLFSKNKTELTFLVCEDNDTEELNTTIYKLIVNTEH
ncbi:DUF6929 family protein [Flavobacterium oreochromis]|uniref:Phytase-like domain-containing protein n=2 Tax=Flavobacterium TaxID=237 RepID=A0A246GBB6_9FLAO|nr:hypothetical protein [Flavobacterium oreochromis]OWP76269.1 hypothetical protein BWG23_08455 [Flavobacterium oreochromis]OWP77939.1 hypothetical protein BWK62_06055 [Flavobacterium oreochromis]POR26559.1 hypothetical protein BWK58_05310 [Flavobacterium columnare]